MPPDPGVVFVLFLFGAIALAGVAYLVLLVARWNSNRIHYVTPSRVRSVRLEPTVQRFYPPFDPEPEPENPPNSAVERRTDEGTGAFVLNLEECAAVARMIEHKTTAEKPTKASTIWAGFGVKKGESARYKRASAIYDALFVIPPEPAALTPVAHRPTAATFAERG